MKRSIAMAFVCLLYLMARPCSAASHPNTYQDGVLVSFQNITSGAQCSSTTTATATSDGPGAAHADSDGHTTCHNVVDRHYTVKVGDTVFIVKKSSSKKGMALGYATLGWSHAFEKDSVLANLLPGTPIMVRTDGEGFHIKVGKRESIYTVVAAQ